MMMMTNDLLLARTPSILFAIAGDAPRDLHTCYLPAALCVAPCYGR